jgi:hypothetical protein
VFLLSLQMIWVEPSTRTQPDKQHGHVTYLSLQPSDSVQV